jgi:uncharacterized protein involved in oxidation of intracellular sulfur
MKFGIILETKEPEKTWNALRFAVTSRKLGHEVKVFLMGEAVECESVSHPKFDTAVSCSSFTRREVSCWRVARA